MKYLRLLVLCLASAASMPSQAADPNEGPIPLIFDTDLGNDCDDVLAMESFTPCRRVGNVSC